MSGSGQDPEWLWITRFAPFPPNYGGDFIYTENLVHGVARIGHSVTVLCSANGAAVPSTAPAVRWEMVDWSDVPVWRTVLQRDASIVRRSRSRAIQQRLAELLDERAWDAVVLDNLSSGWALASVLEARRSRRAARVAYVSHNHERGLRRALFADPALGPAARIGTLIDGPKVAALERRLVRSADVVAVNTEQDLERFASDGVEASAVVVKPGYGGPVVRERRITEGTPRRVVVVGGFLWIAKRANLYRLLEVAVGPLTNAGVTIQVLGSMLDATRGDLRRRFPDVDVVSPVDVMAPHLARARMGVVAEQVGGGFKHKIVEYAMQRVPIAALSGTLSGTGLHAGEDCLVAGDVGALVELMVRSIDDLPELNRLQAAAFDHCHGRFEWSDRAATLVRAVDR
jgi:hypothetical protein